MQVFIIVDGWDKSGLKKVGLNDKINFMDITNEWTKSKGIKGSVVEKQSPNFIFDMTDCPLSEEDIKRKIDGVYISQHTRFVKKIVVLKNGEILKVYDMR